MTHRRVFPSSCPDVSLFGKKPGWRRMILAGAIVPAGLMLAPNLHAADVVLPATQTINSDSGTPIYKEGLMEGFLNTSDDEFTLNPGNSSPELGLRMAQDTTFGPDGWANPRTWIYTGQVYTGPNGTLSFAFNNDDTDWLKINGVVVLNDNGWDTAVAGVANSTTAGITAGGLLAWAPNTWVQFEYRVSDTGGGGAGPSGQNINGASGWNNTTGAVMSWNDEFGSTNASSYIGGLNDLGKPAETADGTPTLFRYQLGLGFEDNYRLQADSTVTINGVNPSVLVPSLSFENTAAATLTVNDGTDTGDPAGFPVHKTLSFTNGTTFTANNQAVTISGTSDVRLGKISDGAFTGNTLLAANPGQFAPGKLIIDNVDAANPNDLNGTTLQVGTDGHLVIRGSNGVNPISTLAQPLAITGTNGRIGIASESGSTTYDNAIEVNESGFIAHTTPSNDTLGSATNGVTIAAGKTLTADISGGSLNIAGAVNGPADTTLTKIGANALTVSGATNVGAVVVDSGRLVFGNTVTLSSATVTDFGFLPNAPATLVTNAGTQATVGTLNLQAGSVQLNGQSTITTTNIGGGNASFAGQTSITTHNVSGGNAIHSGAVTIGTTAVTGGKLTFAGPVTLTGPTTVANGTVVLSNTTGNQLDGAIQVDGGGVFQTVPGAMNGESITLNGGMLSLTGGTGVAAVTGFGGDGTGYQINYNNNANSTAPSVTGDVLQITRPVNDYVGSAYNTTKQDVSKFIVNFTYQEFGNATGNLTDVADGAAFVIQNQGTNALGGGGGGMGYSGVGNSAAFLLNIYGGAQGGVGQQISTGGNGVPAYNPTPGVNIRGGNPINITLTYNGSTVDVKMVDATTGATFTTSYENANIPAAVGGNTAFIGFSGATGGANADQRISNFVYKTATAAEDFGINVNVSAGLQSTINAGAVAHQSNLGTLTMADGGDLMVTGTGNVAFANTSFATAGGTYTLGAQSRELKVGSFTFGAGAGTPTLNKTGDGTLVVESSASNLLPAGTTVNLKGGRLSVLGQAADPNPLGSATIVMDGGGVDLSSKGGDLTFSSAFTLQSNGIISAGAASEAVTTPVTVTVANQLNIGTGQSLTLTGAKQHTIVLNGAAPTTTGGTVNIGGGTVTVNGNAIGGMNLSVSPASGSATLNLPAGGTYGSLSGNKNGTIVVGSGTGNTTLTFNQNNDTTFAGKITPVAGGTVSVVKSGTGMLGLSGSNSLAGGVTINEGVLNVTSSHAVDGAALNLGGGTLRVAPAGLNVLHYDSDAGAEGAWAMTAADFATPESMAAVYQRFEGFFATRTATNGTGTSSTEGGNTAINFQGGEGAPFGILGITDIDNMAVRMTGYINIPEAGTIRFLTNSDDGSVMFIDGLPVVNNNRYQGMGVDSTRGSDTPGNPALPQPVTPTLTAGQHKIDIGFYEGGGGAGIIALYRPVGSSTDIIITNDVLGGFSGANAVNVTANSSIDLQGSSSRFGTLTLAGGTTLSVTAGNAIFGGTVLPTEGGVYTVDKAAGSMVLGSIDSGSRQVTLNKTGDGTLVLNETVTPQFQNAASAINVNGGGLAVVLDPFGTSPLGSAQVTLNGGNLFVGSKLQASEVTLTNAFTVAQDATIAAGNFGGGAVNGQVAKLQSLDIAASRTLTLRSQNGYTLGVTGAITGAGTLKVGGGIVTAESTTNVGNIQITEGTLTAKGNVTSTGGVTIDAKGTLAVGDSLAAPTVAYSGGQLAINGGTLAARGGVADFSGADVAFAPAQTTKTQDTLNAALHNGFTGPAGGFGTTEGTAATFARTPGYTQVLDGNRFEGLNFGPVNAGDAALATFFAAPNAAADAFTATFSGMFTAAETGLHEFGYSINDDGAAFWVDLNQNGVFELNGSSGSERLAFSNVCCGGADPTIGTMGGATLIAGESYKMALILQDTGGGGSVSGIFKTPSMGFAEIINPNPAFQSNVWSTETTTGGGRLQVDAGAEMKMSSFTGASEVVLAGGNAVLSLNSATATTSTAGIVRTSNLPPGASATINVGQNNTFDISNLTVSNDGVLIKAGKGTVIAENQSLGLGSLLQVDDGLMVLKSTTARASAGNAANAGGAVVNGGTLQVEGTVRGGITVNIGGRLTGTGTLGLVTSQNGIIAPGVDAAGVLSTRDLNLSGGTLELEISSASVFDQLKVTGSVNLLTDVNLTLSLGGFDPSDDSTMQFKIIDNDDLDLVNTTAFFAYNGQRLINNTTFLVGTQQFKINYAGGDGNDVVLTAVPEPTTAVTLIGALGTLIGMQRFRRRKA